MKTFTESIPLKSNSSYIIREFTHGQMTYPLHQHPQVEISLVIEGEGTRIIGDHVAPFEAGDLVMVGGDLPHRWFAPVDYQGETHNIILQIRLPFLGEGFLEREEMLPIKQLFELANRGLEITGATALKVQTMIKELLNLQGFDGILTLLKIFHLIAQSKEINVLSGIGFSMPQSLKGYDTINKVINYLMANYTGEISLDEAAQQAKMSKSAFAHFFKKRTNINFSKYINELRISHSAYLLTQSQLTVSEICFQSGFNNLSYFNRVFLEKYSMSPSKYKAKWMLVQF
jgi:AraC-like DNA-binding protein